MATKLGSLRTCDSPVQSSQDDGGWKIVKKTCGCTITYGQYHGFGSRSVVSTTVCNKMVEVCDVCGCQNWPHNDCRCGEAAHA